MTARALFLILLLPFAAQAGEGCRLAPEQALRDLRSQKTEPDLRAAQGTCLMRHYLSLPEVAGAALTIVKDPAEDLFLREDLINAFADSRLRRQVKVRESLVPDLKKEDQEALARTASTAGRLLAVAQAVKSMDETVPVTSREGEFVRALAEIAESDDSPVILRASAVAALESVLDKIVQSGVYDERLVRTGQECLRNVASREDSASFFSGASEAYGRLAQAGLPYFSARSGRALASESR